MGGRSTRHDRFRRPPPRRSASTARLVGTTVLLALRAIRRHLLRSFLTVLGIVIGVFAVVTMVTLGKGATESVRQQISSLGANILTVLPGQAIGRGGGGETPPPFKLEDRRRDPRPGRRRHRGRPAGAVVARPRCATPPTGRPRSTAPPTPISTRRTGRSTDGRRFTDAEEQAGKSVCLIGNTVKQNLYPTEAPVGTRAAARQRQLRR